MFLGSSHTSSPGVWKPRVCCPRQSPPKKIDKNFPREIHLRCLSGFSTESPSRCFPTTWQRFGGRIHRIFSSPYRVYGYTVYGVFFRNETKTLQHVKRPKKIEPFLFDNVWMFTDLQSKGQGYCNKKIKLWFSMFFFQQFGSQ